jgi:hypothetical protein
MANLTVHWIDRGREPQCAPNPDYPDGIDLDATRQGDRCCWTKLAPYPAPRCGYFVIRCDECDQNVVCTTAGRPDDPRSIRIRCKSQ